MREVHLYVNLWKKYLPVIRILLKKSATEEQQLGLNRSEFEATGSRDKAGYFFNLELSNLKGANDISGSAVARDLKDVLIQSSNIKEILRGGHYKLNLDSSFTLHIRKIASL